MWWEAQRQEAYFRAGYRCEACGVEKELARFHAWLEAHEVYSLNYAKAELTFVEVVALCHSCHNFIHAGRMKALVEQGKMVRGKRLAILKHGKEVLKAANLTPTIDSPTFVPWESWRLIYKGIPYKGLFPTYESWRNNHDL